MLEQILPEVVLSAECVGEPPAGGLFPAEETAVADAVDRRRREYAAVRRCARACLRRLGYDDQPLLAGVDGAPGWPAGARGSMTHCEGYAAAAVVAARHAAAIGIDAEPDLPLPDGVADLVATPLERERLSALPRDADGPCWDRLLFSAKEAVFKAWSPLTGEWLDPEDTEVRFEPAAGTFTAAVAAGRRPGVARRMTGFDGRWTRADGILVTAVVLGGSSLPPATG